MGVETVLEPEVIRACGEIDLPQAYSHVLAPAWRAWVRQIPILPNAQRSKVERLSYDSPVFEGMQLPRNHRVVAFSRASRKTSVKAR